jgi:transcriptional regulator with XRE-family HTH domain
MISPAQRPLAPLERKALLKAAATIKKLTLVQVASELGVSYNHMMLVLRGDRLGSKRLESAIAAFLDYPKEILFSTRRYRNWSQDKDCPKR